VYETYSREIVTIIDAKAPACADEMHKEGKPLPEPILHPSPRD